MNILIIEMNHKIQIGSTSHELMDMPQGKSQIASNGQTVHYIPKRRHYVLPYIVHVSESMCFVLMELKTIIGYAILV